VQATADAVRAAGGTMEVHAADVTSAAACKGAVAAALDAYGQLDVLGNVAGIGRAEHFVDVSEADYRRMMGVNVDGYVFMSQAAIPHLLHEGGCIVNIASIAGLMGQAYTVVYCMTKGAVVQLTKALAMEYVKTPLRVNAIAPGGIETNLTATFAMPADVDFDLVAPYSGFRGMGRPEDIAVLFSFLASDEAENVHGAILTSDRGVTAG
jgi:NAD(P)-dependent dehydrogenase (short-subunit alcohol dehydrogenase family)